MIDKQNWDGRDRRKSAIEVADEAKLELEKHLVECSARYDILASKVETQGRQLARVENTVEKIDDKLDDIVDAINDKIDAKVQVMQDKMANAAQSNNDKWNQALVALLTLAIGIIGWGIDHYIIK